MTADNRRAHACRWIDDQAAWGAFAPGNYLLADLYRRYLSDARAEGALRPAGPRQFDAALRGVFGDEARRRTNRGVTYTLDADFLAYLGELVRFARADEAAGEAP